MATFASLPFVRRAVLFGTYLSLAVIFLRPHLFPYTLFLTFELCGWLLLLQFAISTQPAAPTLSPYVTKAWPRFSMGAMAGAMAVMAAVAVWVSKEVLP